MINHSTGTKFVMLVEIPGPWVILGVISAFLVGVGGLYGYFKIRPLIKTDGGSVQSDRIEYYERQLIDMKIRLDVLEMQDPEPKTKDSSVELRDFLVKLMDNQAYKQPERSESEKVQKKPTPTPKTNNIGYSNPIDYVLYLITDRSMTSRDIQITLKKSREHTSRLMKKLFEDGYVQRNTNSKPYTYSITEKGRVRIGGIRPEQ